MGNTQGCNDCLENWIALEPIITCFDPNGCLNTRCCEPQALPPPGLPIGYSETCCTQCKCFDGRPIYLPEVDMSDQINNKNKGNVGNTNILNEQNQVPPCNCCLRLGQICCCPFVGCCLGGYNSIFSCCIFCGIGCNTCQSCTWSSLSWLALCHCQHCFYSQYYCSSCRSHCGLACIHFWCCPIQSLSSYLRVCCYSCKQRIHSFSQISQISHPISDYYKSKFKKTLNQPTNSFKTFRP